MRGDDPEAGNLPEAKRVFRSLAISASPQYFTFQNPRNVSQQVANTRDVARASWEESMRISREHNGAFLAQMPPRFSSGDEQRS